MIKLARKSKAKTRLTSSARSRTHALTNFEKWMILKKIEQFFILTEIFTHSLLLQRREGSERGRRFTRGHVYQEFINQTEKRRKGVKTLKD